MNPKYWMEMARAIEENFDRFDGFVVLHGTDTMSYTASALSFMLENLHKPVIITGSQLPIGEVRTDGEENLITALQIAAATDINDEPMVQEVAILFENYLWRGNRSTKMMCRQLQCLQEQQLSVACQDRARHPLQRGSVDARRHEASAEGALCNGHQCDVS